MGNIWNGEKVRLRAVEMSDLKDYFLADEEYDTDSQRCGDRVLYPLGSAMMEDRVAKLSKQSPVDDEFFLIIEDKEGHPVGNINTHSMSRGDGFFEYGLGVKKKYRGKGYASEAIKILLNFCFMELGFRKAEARVYSFNEASIALHRKLGFVQEGLLRSHHFANGEYHDEYCFGMTKDEFLELHKAK